MLDHPAAPEVLGEGELPTARGARERHQARGAAVELVAPTIEAFIRARKPESEAVLVLWDAWQVDHAASTIWREMYYALQATLEQLNEAAARAAAA